MKNREKATKALAKESKIVTQVGLKQDEINKLQQAGKKKARALKKVLSSHSKEMEAAMVATKNRCEMEMELIREESANTEIMLTAMDILQSLALHRLDELQYIMTRAMLSGE